MKREEWSEHFVKQKGAGLSVVSYCKREGLRSSYSKAYKIVTTDSNHLMPVADNVLDRDFQATARTQSKMGWGHHLHPYHGGFCLSRGRV